MKYFLLFIALLIILIIPKIVFGQNDSILQAGIALYDKGEYEKSIEILEIRLKTAKDNKEPKVQEVIYNSIGNNYSNIGKTTEALSAYQHSTTIAEEIGDKQSIGRSLKNIGALYADTKDFDKAMQKYNEAETIALPINDTSTIADCANNKGVIFEQQKKYDSALAQYHTAIALYTALKQDDRIAILYNNLGIVYKYLKDYDKSIECYQQSLALGEKIGSKFLVAANQINIGNVYEMKGDYKKAIELIEKGLQTGKELNSQSLIIEAYESLAEDHAKSGDYEGGYDLYKKYISVKDSFMGLERSKQLTEIQTKYETEKKEKQIIILERTRYRMLAIIGIMSLVLIVAFSLYNRQQARQKQRRGKAIAAAEYNERMRIAKDVHDDLGSGLSKISLMAAIAQNKAVGNAPLGNDIKHISTVSKELVDNMRDLIWVLNPENTTLEQLASRLREYCSDYLDGMQITAAIDFEPNIPDLKILREAQRNIFLTVKEAINNSVKHSGATAISIGLKITAAELQISVSDNGKGFDIAAIKSGGNGLRNMKQRIEAIGGTYTLTSVVNEGSATSISISLAKLADAKNTTLV